MLEGWSPEVDKGFNDDGLFDPRAMESGLTRACPVAWAVSGPRILEQTGESSR